MLSGSKSAPWDGRSGMILGILYTALCCRGEPDLQIRLQSLLPVPNSSKAEPLNGLNGLFWYGLVQQS